MHRVIVTVEREGEARGRDLEVPAEVEAQRLAAMIADALGWDQGTTGWSISYEILAEPPGRALAPDESLADAGAWDGARLVFRPSEVPPPLPSRSFERPEGGEESGPVVGWSPLLEPGELGVAPMGEEPPGPVDVGGMPEGGPPGFDEDGPAQEEDEGYVWRQLD